MSKEDGKTTDGFPGHKVMGLGIVLVDKVHMVEPAGLISRVVDVEGFIDLLRSCSGWDFQQSKFHLD